MQIWYEGPRVRDEGDFTVEINPGSKRPFAIIGLEAGYRSDKTALVIGSPDEARRLREAAAAVASKFTQVNFDAAPEKAERQLTEAWARPEDLADADES